MIVRTLGSACQLFEIAGRKGGRQINVPMHTSSAHVLAASSTLNPGNLLKKIPYVGRTYVGSPLKNALEYSM